MKTTKGRFRLFALVLAIVAACLATTSAAHAASNKDGHYQTTSSLAVTWQQGSKPQYRCDDITIVDDMWATYLTDESKWNSSSTFDYEAMKASFIVAAQGGGRWGVSQVTDRGRGADQLIKQIHVYWTEDTSLSLAWDWSDTDIYAYSSTGRMSYATIGCTKLYSGWGDQTVGVVAGVLNGSVAVQVSNNTQALTTDYSQLVQSYVVGTDHPNYPAGYEGELVKAGATPNAATYVAMGDSFSSGEGNPPFENGTDVDSNKCHRSAKAYPRLLQADTSLNLGPTAFVACSGATTHNVLNGQNGEPAQVDALSEQTKVVTLTLGGNDVGFGEYANKCFWGYCGPATDNSDFEAILDRINDPAFTNNLELVYRKILTQAPRADVYVADYPSFADGPAYMCSWLDFTGVSTIQASLNSTIALAIAKVRGEKEDYKNRLHYVSTNGAGSPFDGKHVCSDDSYLYGLHVINQEYSFHPNEKGHVAYAELLERLMD